MEKPLEIPGRKWGIAIIALIALVYTTPWDNYLVSSKIWEYGEGRVLESLIIGYVPIEEYLFFILQPIMTGCFLLLYLERNPQSMDVLSKPLERGKVAWFGAAIYLSLFVFGVICLVSLGPHYRYLGLILAWASPVLAFQWGYGGGTLWKLRKPFIGAVRAPTIYLWVVDLIAIEWRIWHILPETSTGYKLITLPIEEAIFFLVTNLLVVQGLLLFYQLTVNLKAKRQKRHQAPMAAESI